MNTVLENVLSKIYKLTYGLDNMNYFNIFRDSFNQIFGHSNFVLTTVDGNIRKLLVIITRDIKVLRVNVDVNDGSTDFEVRISTEDIWDYEVVYPILTQLKELRTTQSQMILSRLEIMRRNFINDF